MPSAPLDRPAGKQGGQDMEVLIGVDPHKASHTVAALNEQGELLEHASFCASRAGLRSMMRWAKRFDKRRSLGGGGCKRPGPPARTIPRQLRRESG